jgi:hypothetical protein
MIKELVAKIGLDTSGFNKGIKDVKKQTSDVKDNIKGIGDEGKKSAKKVDSASGQMKKSFGGVNSTLSNLGKTLGAVFAVDQLIGFAKAVVNTQAEFQRMEAVLTNTLGSRGAAQAAMGQIVDFASKTPFQVNELTDAFVKLSNQGFVPTMAQMTKMGDLASSVGKSFDQLAEAVIDAQVGEFERLKEFGIKASAQGDKIKFSFKGLSTEVGKTSEEIQKYILSLGDLEGVTGGMALISETTGGKLSNFGDNVTRLTKSIGDSSSGLIYGILTASNAILDHFATSLEAVNKVADKFNKGALEQLGMTFAAVFDAKYANVLKLQAKAIKQVEQASFDAMMAGRAYFESEEKARSDAYDKEQDLIAQSIEANKKRYSELLKEQRKALSDFMNTMKRFKLPVGTLAKESTVLGIGGDPLSKMKAQTSGLGLVIDPKQTEILKAHNNEVERGNVMLSNMQMVGGLLTTTFEGMFNAIIEGGNPFKILIEQVKRLVIQLLAAVAVASILNALLGGAGVASGAGGTFGGKEGFKSLFSMFSGFSLPKFAKGGMVTGLTTAVLGDNASGKEAVIPFERMGSFLNQFGGGNQNMKVEVVGVVRGEDIYLSNSNYLQRKNRTLGF